MDQQALARVGQTPERAPLAIRDIRLGMVSAALFGSSQQGLEVFDDAVRFASGVKFPMALGECGRARFKGRVAQRMIERQR